MHFLRLTCSLQDADGLIGELWEAGTQGLQEIEHGETLDIIAGFEDASLGPELLERFTSFKPEWEAQPDVDWVAETEQRWPAREVGSRVFLAPPWSTLETPAGRVRVIHNPGSASGTGEHPCTQLMLQALETHVAADYAVADIGTGSGILAIAALQLGAAKAYAIDTDEEALQTARENFERNGLAAWLAVGEPACLKDGCADLILANISGTVLLALFDDLLRLARPGAWMILSGFTEGEVQPFLHLLPGAEISGLHEWRCVCAQVPSPLSAAGVP